MEVQKPDCVYSYLAYNDELNLDLFHQELIKRNIKIAFPRISDFSSGIMVFHRWCPEDPLKANKYGILEPSSHLPLATATENSWILIPALAAGLNGSRIGYGGGFYDRFLEKTEISEKIVCIFDAQWREDIPTDRHDQSFTTLCNPHGLFKISL